MKRKFQRVILYGGITAVLILAFAIWHVRLDMWHFQVEQAVRSEFRLLETFPDKPLWLDANIVGPDGQSVSKEDLQGHFIVLNVWSTACKQCVKELRSLQRLKGRYTERDVAVIAVSVDSTGSLDSVMAFLERRNVGEVAIYHDVNGDIQQSGLVRTLPTTFLINSKGQLLYRVTGPVRWLDIKVIRFLEVLLHKDL